MRSRVEKDLDLKLQLQKHNEINLKHLIIHRWADPSTPILIYELNSTGALKFLKNGHQVLSTTMATSNSTIAVAEIENDKTIYVVFS